MATTTDNTTYQPVIDPATKAWLDRLEAAGAGSPPLYELSPEDAREVLRSIQASVAIDLAPAEIEDRSIAGGPTKEISIRIIRPSNATGLLPMIFHTHGGGWILGDKDTHERLYRELANAAQAIVVFVDYTPAPDAQYPVQVEQAYAALEWAFSNADEIGVDPDRAALFGDSVGGNMAAALTLMAKERRGPKLAAQVLFYPVTNANLDTDTYEIYADGPWLTREAMRWFWDSYLPDEERRREVTASPLMASIDQLRDLPPALVINGQHDVLCAEGEAYARRLTEAGVPVTQVRYGGTIHDFVLLNPISGTPAVRAAIAQAAGYLRKALAT
jgi:acetyl esterase/lipase